DWEMHPTLEQHPQDGAPILREEGYPEEVVEGVLSHAEHLGLPRDTLMKKTLFACDELSGFIHACGLVRPDGIETLEPKSVKKKLKQPSFAAGVNRDDVYKGAEERGVDRSDEAGERAGGDPARLEAECSLARDERAARFVLGLREVAGEGDAQLLRLCDDQHPGHVGAAEPLLAGDGVEVEMRRIDPDRAGRLGAVHEHGQARLGLDALGVERVPGDPRDV